MKTVFDANDPTTLEILDPSLNTKIVFKKRNEDGYTHYCFSDYDVSYFIHDRRVSESNFKIYILARQTSALQQIMETLQKHAFDEKDLALGSLK